jgi:predicted transcriptional regulator
MEPVALPVLLLVRVEVTVAMAALMIQILTVMAAVQVLGVTLETAETGIPPHLVRLLNRLVELAGLVVEERLAGAV